MYIKLTNYGYATATTRNIMSPMLIICDGAESRVGGLGEASAGMTHPLCKLSCDGHRILLI